MSACSSLPTAHIKTAAPETTVPSITTEFSPSLEAAALVSSFNESAETPATLIAKTCLPEISFASCKRPGSCAIASLLCSAASSRCVFLSSSSESETRASTSSAGAFRVCASFRIKFRSWCKMFKASMPTRASILLEPEPTDDSEVRLTRPICELRDT